MALAQDYQQFQPYQGYQPYQPPQPAQGSFPPLSNQPQLYIAPSRGSAYGTPQSQPVCVQTSTRIICQ
jgi:hypothetical protein